MTTDELIDAVREWGKQKGIDNADKQTLKLLEESGELASELCRGRYRSDEVKDALGDIEVVLIILADILGYDLMECLASAYNVIKDRKGKTVNHSFVKDV